MDLEHFDFAGEFSASSTSVMVYCDESLFREILIAALDTDPTLTVVGAAATRSTAIDLARRTNPDVVLVDVELGDERNAMATAAEIKYEHPAIGVVLLSTHRDTRSLTGLIGESTTGWSLLLKQEVADVHSLAGAIVSAASGQLALDESAFDDSFPRPKSLLERLTRGQMETLMFIASGYADSAIAEELKIDDKLVGPLIKTIYRDLHIDENEAVDQRVRATLLYLEETAQVST